MTYEIRKKIEEYIEEAYVGLNDDERQAPFTVGDLKAETRDDIEFGYQLGYEEAMKQVVEKTASAVYIASKVAMAAGSKEPSQDELWEEKDVIRLIEDLKDYTYESHCILGHDERSAKDFIELHKKRYRITRI